MFSAFEIFVLNFFFFAIFLSREVKTKEAPNKDTDQQRVAQDLLRANIRELGSVFEKTGAG